MSKEIQFMARMPVRVLLTVDEDGDVTGIELASIQSVAVDDFFSSLDDDELAALHKEIGNG